MRGFSANELPGREGVMYTIREKGTGTPVLLMSEMERYYDRGNGTLQLWGNAVYKPSKFPRTLWIRLSSTSLKHGATMAMSARRIRL